MEILDQKRTGRTIRISTAVPFLKNKLSKKSVNENGLDPDLDSHP